MSDEGLRDWLHGRIAELERIVADMARERDERLLTHQREVQALEKERDDAQNQCAEEQRAANEEEQRAIAVERALRVYGKHTSACDLDEPCSCGLDGALKNLSKDPQQ